jgi:uncharacterized protein YjbJ (UPF0337 family)
MAGRTEELKGSVKETAGKAFGNERLEAEGKADKLKGKSERHAAGMKDSAVGNVKKAAGNLTGDDSMYAEGQAQDVKGKAERLG